MSESEPQPTWQDLLPKPDPEPETPDADSETPWDSWIPGRATTEQGETYTDHARGSFVDRSGIGAAARARLKRPRDGGWSSEQRSRAPAALLALAGVVVVVVVVLGVNLSASSSKSGPLAAVPASTAHAATTAAASTTTEPYPHATADCYPVKSADVVVGAGPGDPTTAPGAILGFQWAYYSDRSGARARDWVAAGADVPDAAAIQAGIDSVPAATKYCVHVSRADSDGSGGTWNVVLSEQFPTDKTPQQWAQTVTTRAEGGRVLITAIRKAN